MIEILLVVCAKSCYIFVNHFTSCVTDDYLPQSQQYIISAHGNSLFNYRFQSYVIQNLCTCIYIQV